MKSLRSFILCMLPSILLLSCNEREPQENSGNIQLSPITILPAAIDGCSELFSSSEQDFSNRQFLFVSNLMEKGFINTGGEMIELKRNEKETSEPSPSRYIQVYEGHGYRLTLDVSREKDYDEGGLYRGTVTIEKEGAKKEIAVYGESGC